ncbi:hypothetical protein CDL12_23410 [Handroanthus impetiginosus]|uniref:DUF1365 domain-containing protein n=1 Tax=Handroanthus impetiginosus TaxID=429701 RepID=A0A2G9GFJ7_9LAMI|nr:hypothetical protein CDL12_23410 [Handroanthus impetiginosus]
MEILYLICSILSTTITSFFLSLLLPFRYLLHRISGVRASTKALDFVALYQGTVWHERRRPVYHSFRYPVRYALIDLDAAPRAPPNHLSAKEARRFAKTNGPVFLLTIPPSVGYEQNPLSLYYCYEVEGSTRILKKCIAEVTNTPWGERVTFLFNPNSDLVAKPLHVSPFMDMLGNWSMKTNEPAENLHVVISVQHPELGNYFTASLTAKKVSSLTSGDHSGFFWLMPHKVALWIYWHALKLWWKQVSFIQHPRYQSPAYREEALVRNKNIQCCPSFGNNEANNLQIQKQACDSAADMLNNRCFTWRDATWPWC